MAENKNKASFGRYLMEERLKQDLKIEEISKTTKIGAKTLLNIENENHSKLPAEVFVKGFLRLYARTLGKDGEEAVRRYSASRKIYIAGTNTSDSIEEINLDYGFRVLFSCGLFICEVILIIFCLYFFYLYF